MLKTVHVEGGDGGCDYFSDWSTTPEQDRLATEALIKAYGKGGPLAHFGVVTNNCQSAVDYTLAKAGVTHSTSIGPNFASSINSNKGYADTSGPLFHFTPPSQTLSPGIATPEQALQDYSTTQGTF